MDDKERLLELGQEWDRLDAMALQDEDDLERGIIAKRESILRSLSYQAHRREIEEEANRIRGIL